jgi:hypothetical protein
MEARPVERALIAETSGKRYLGIYTCAPSKRGAAFLFLPGSGPLDVDGQVGPNRFSYELATGLALRGWSSLRFGKRPLSGPAREHASYQEEYVEPVTALEKAAHAELGVPRCWILFGHSLGGHVAGLAGAAIPGVVGVVLFNAPAERLGDVVRRQFAEHAVLHPAQQEILRAVTGDAEAGPLGDYFRWAQRFDPGEALRALAVPILAIACGMDAQVPADELDRWSKTLSGLDVELRRFEELNHLGAAAEERALENVLRPAPIDLRVLDEVARWADSLMETGAR